MLCLVARCRNDVVRYPLPATPADLGSDEENAIWLPFDGVSRHHALVTPLPRGVQLTDLHSKNGLIVDGTRVDELPLEPGRYVRIGHAVLGVEEHATSDLLAASPVSTARVAARLAQSTRSLHAPPSEREAIKLMARLQKSPKLLRHHPQSVLDEVRRLLTASAVQWIEAEDDAGLIASAGDIDTAVRDEIIAFARKRTCEQEIRRIRETPALFTSAADPLRIVVATFPKPARMIAEWEKSFFEFIADKLLHSRPDRVREPVGEPPQATPFLCASKAMAEVDALTRLAAESARPVLLLGETGTGKEIVARRIHELSARGRKPYVTVSCTAIADGLLEAELFGIEARVATEVDARPGLFAEAEGGTLFIDEIGESPRIQAALLRVVQFREIRSVGGRGTRPVNVRVILATRRPLGDGIGCVRHDLAFRCDQIEIRPLRERREDIRPLAHHFLEQSCEELGIAPVAISLKALDLLERYDWPGNVRELEYEIARTVARHGRGGRMLHAEHFRLRAPEVKPATLHERADAEKRRGIEGALRDTHGNVAAAARLLGVSRNGLTKTIARLEIDRKVTSTAR